jgi:hypothetical protein
LSFRGIWSPHQFRYLLGCKFSCVSSHTREPLDAAPTL